MRLNFFGRERGTREGEVGSSPLTPEELARLADDDEVNIGPVPPGGERVLESLEPWELPQFEPDEALAIAKRFAKLVMEDRRSAPGEEEQL
jgi:hypothetical protein